jgi:hypothetical protein
MNTVASAGVLFRVKDNYNFYALALSLKRKTKELWKCVDGQYTLLGKIEDGGFVKNQWYRVLIKFNRMYIKIFIDFDLKLIQNGEINTTVPVAISKVFDIRDVDLRKGSFGLFSDDMTDFSSNLISYKPSVCNPINRVSSVKVISFQCSRFAEK